MAAIKWKSDIDKFVVVANFERRGWDQVRHCYESKPGRASSLHSSSVLMLAWEALESSADNSVNTSIAETAF